MINVVSANLLAECPYKKYAIPALRINFEIRAKKFIDRIKELMPDVILLQEVDKGWRNEIDLNILKLGYHVQDGLGRNKNLGLAILWKKDTMKPASARVVNFGEAGILSMEFLHCQSNEIVCFVTLHAPWGEAEKYHNFYNTIASANGHVLIAGDFNTDVSANSNVLIPSDLITDNPKENNNYKYFFGKLFTLNKGYKDITDSIQFTSRNVKTNTEEKIDFIIGKNCGAINTCIYPDKLALLLPHVLGGEFDLEEESNHFSDHALLSSTIVLT